ncbi:MAG: hypothetical protein OXH93_19460 [Caldilineaceae bacterium]|nr:hypothetical protein [Caldilineaceae bacterium]
MKIRWTKGQIEQLEEQILECLREDNPQSVRHIFYRMVNPQLPVSVPKDDSGYRRVQNRCKVMRERGRLPYRWIADNSRTGYITTSYTGLDDFILSTAGLYRRDIWHEHGVHCEVWCESLSIASVLRALCAIWAVSLFPTRGFSSLTFLHDAAEHLDYIAQTGAQSAHLFYVGDYDPAGRLIDEDVETKIRRYSQQDLHDWLRFERIAINEGQIRAYNLPTKPRKKSEKRKPEMLETVEAEAMQAGILRGLLADRIAALLPEGALAAAQVAEKSERLHLRKLAAIDRN